MSAHSSPSQDKFPPSSELRKEFALRIQKIPPQSRNDSIISHRILFRYGAIRRTTPIFIIFQWKGRRETIISLQSSRRDFLRTIALTGLAVWVPKSKQAQESKSPNGKVNVACIVIEGK